MTCATRATTRRDAYQDRYESRGRAQVGGPIYRCEARALRGVPQRSLRARA